MKKTRGRLLSLVLAVLLCVAVLPTGSARAMGDAMSLDQVKALMNAETLYPQKTGYIELDRMLEELVAPYKGKDTYMPHSHRKSAAHSLTLKDFLPLAFP